MQEPFESLTVHDGIDWEASGDYRRFFARSEHLAFVGVDPEAGPVVALVRLKPEDVRFRLVAATASADAFFLFL